MTITAVVNRRGGVGKTATAHALGAGLALRGYKVLFIDLDSQSNLTYDLGMDPLKARYSTMDILTGAVNLDEAITHGKAWDMIPAAPALATADAVITETGKEYRLREALAPISTLYDFCIVDTPPALNTLTVNALTAASGAIIPAQAEIHSIQGIGLLSETIGQVRRYCNQQLQIYGIVLTRYNGRTILSQNMKTNLEAAAEQLGTKLYGTPIRESISIKEAQAMQTDIFTYAPKSNGAKDYTALVNEFLEDLRGE